MGVVLCCITPLLWLCPRMLLLLLLPTHPQMLEAHACPPWSRHPFHFSPLQQPHRQGKSLGKLRTLQILVMWRSRSCWHSLGGM